MTPPASSPASGVGQQKKVLRTALLAARAERWREPSEDVRRVAALLALAELQHARTVAAYAALPGEPGTQPLLDELLAAGRRVLLPLSKPDASMEFRVYDGRLVTGRHGIAVPPPDAPAALLAEADVVVVPALAADPTGRRLGRGAGSYDRALAELQIVRPDALTIAVIHAEELLEQLPVERHDVQVGAVLAGDRLVRCIPA